MRLHFVSVIVHEMYIVHTFSHTRLFFHILKLKPKFPILSFPGPALLKARNARVDQRDAGVSVLLPWQPCASLYPIGMARLITKPRIVILLHVFFYLAGLLYDYTGNYNIVFFLSSGLVICGSCVMFLIPNLLPPKQSLVKIFMPEIVVSVPEKLDDDQESFVGNESALVRTSYVSFKNFADEFEVERSRLLLDRTPNVGSRPSSFILFSIVPEGSYRDLSLSNERHSNSREASYTSLARLAELRVESRVNSCVRLEPVAEAETSDATVSSECLDVIVSTRPVEAELATTSLSCNSTEKSATLVKTLDVVSDHKVNDTDDNVPSITICMSTESGFASEESVATATDTKNFVSSKSDLDENRLSGYSWNSTGSDLSWKTQCSEAGTEDSGYAEEVSPCGVGDQVEISQDKSSINSSFSQDNLKSDMTEQESHCSCDGTLNAKETKTSFISLETKGVVHAHSLKEGPLIIDPGPTDYYSELVDSQLNDQSQFACGKEENDFDSKSVTNAQETSWQKKVFNAKCPPPPDIYSELFEGILEQVNQYADSLSEFSISGHDPLKAWPKVSMTDVQACERETVV